MTWQHNIRWGVGHWLIAVWMRSGNETKRHGFPVEDLGQFMRDGEWIPGSESRVRYAMLGAIMGVRRLVHQGMEFVNGEIGPANDDSTRGNPFAYSLPLAWDGEFLALRTDARPVEVVP